MPINAKDTDFDILKCLMCQLLKQQRGLTCLYMDLISLLDTAHRPSVSLAC